MATDRQPYRESLRQLRSALPSSRFQGDQDSQAREVLRILLDRAVPNDGTTLTPHGPSACPNCGSPVLSERSPYCGSACKEEAAFVRQLRVGLMEGTIVDEDRQIALGEKLWHVLGGGYPRRQSLIFPKSLEKVIRRAQGHCESCGAVATTVDHIGSG